MTTADIVNIAKVCVSLVIRDIELGKETDLNLPKKIQTEADNLEFAYNNNYSGINIIGFADYVYGMCGGYAYEAEGIIGSSSGVIVNPGVAPGLPIANQYFGFASAGGTTITFPLAINKTILDIHRSSFDVGEIIFDGTPVDNQVKWNTLLGQVTVAADVPFTTGEFVRIMVS